MPLGLCPQWEDWDPKNKLQNTKEAMTLADDHLGVAQVSWLDQIIMHQLLHDRPPLA